MGSLIIEDDANIRAYGAVGAAGIGAGHDTVAGDITINGGFIKAYGGKQAAGIGCGNQEGAGDGGNGKNITITGGVVEAHGGAGIGGSDGGDLKGTLKITGGMITAKGGGGGAGIGGGEEGYLNSLEITDGIITATGGKWAAGIGGGNAQGSGDGGSVGNIYIAGGRIKAYGGGATDTTEGEGGAGIGGSDGGYVTKFVIEEKSPLNIVAQGGKWGAGIGSASEGYVKYPLKSLEIKLNGGTITATGGKQGAGIGGGNTRAEDIKISGNGEIHATGWDESCAIGGGEREDGGTVTIIGDTASDSLENRPLKIYANAYGTSGAAVIGAATSIGEDITIKNAYIVMESENNKKYDLLTAGIGGGDDRDLGDRSIGNILIENCYIKDVHGAERKGCTIGAGFSGDVKNITIRNSEVYGGTIGTCATQQLLAEVVVDGITIENSTIVAENRSDLQKAAIGGGSYSAVSQIDIINSTVTAYSKDGAGIGTGGYESNSGGDAVFMTGCACGDINITGSNVTATGGRGSAGIGGGWGTSVDDVTIKNSTVVAASVDPRDGEGGSGIGGGHGESAGNILIENSTVKATASNYCAGIGSDGGSGGTVVWNTTCHSITLKGSTVTATGGKSAAGIGSGAGAQFAGDASIHIEDSTVTAQGGNKGAGIGAGANGNLGAGAEACDIYISGKSRVTATGGDGAAGIGGGYGGGADLIDIDLDETVYDASTGEWKYYVKGYATYGGAGIGGGGEHGSDSGSSIGTAGHDADSIQIHGGYVYGRGGGETKEAEYQGVGAGIGGGGRGGCLKEFIVTGGVVQAEAGGPLSPKTAGNDIGSGGNDVDSFGTDGKATISGGTVWGDLSDEFTIVINGGSVSCNTSQAKNSGGTKVYRTLMQTGEKYMQMQDLSTSMENYKTYDIFADSTGRVYLYLPETSRDDGSTADYTYNGVSRHYYGKTTGSGDEWIKMDGKLEFNVPKDPIVGKDFEVTVKEDPGIPSGTSISLEVVGANITTVSEQNTMPGAGVTLRASDWTAYTVSAELASTSEMYWGAKGTHYGSVNLKESTITITENPTKVYDAAAVSDPDVECSSDGEITYRYYRWDGSAKGEQLSQRPTETGTYAVEASVAATRNYTAATSETVVFTIEERPVRLGMNVTGSGTSATITAYVFGAVDDPGKVSVSINGTKKGEMPVTAKSITAGGSVVTVYEGSYTASEVPGETYTVKLSYVDTANYVCMNEPERTYNKNLAERTLTVNNLETTYGADGWDAGGQITATPSKKSEDGDTYTYNILYDEWHDTYNVETAVSVDDATGKVTYRNAGLAVVEVTAKDNKNVYQDAVAYSVIRINRADMTVKSQAERNSHALRTVVYGDIDNTSISYDLEYDVLKLGDTEGDFANGTLNEVPLKRTTSAGEASIGIRKSGKDVTINGRLYHNVFYSRNYNLKLEPGTVEVTPAVLYISANDVTGVYGTEPEYTYTMGDGHGGHGLKPWDKEEDVIASVGIAKDYITYKPGTYPDAIEVKTKEGVINYAFDDGTGVSTITAGTLTVQKADLTMDAVIASKVYDKQAVVPQITVKPVAEITEGLADCPEAVIHYYELNSDGSVTKLDAAPKDAGHYEAWIHVPFNDYYKTASEIVNFTIRKARPDVVKPTLPDLKIKDGLTLADQPLPAGWKWISPDKKLGLGYASGYAVYTPEDTRNYFKAIRSLSFNVYDENADNADNGDDTDGGTDGSDDKDGGTDGSDDKDGGTDGSGGGTDNSGGGSGDANKPDNGSGSGNGSNNADGNADNTGKGANGSVLTGDSSPILLWVILGIAALGVICGLMVVAGKKKKK